MALNNTAKQALANALKSYVIDPQSDTAEDDAIEAFIEAISTFIEAAVVTVSVTTADIGLQSIASPSGPIETLGPIQETTISGALTYPNNTIP
jgi:hypothetical protein